MTIFSFYSIRFKKNSLYINFKKFLAGFWRPPPGGARGQLPPLATPLPPPPDKIPSPTNLSLRKPRLLDIYTPPPPVVGVNCFWEEG